MNERIVKLRADYAKNEDKIAALQTKNKKLAEKIRQLENTEIIGAVRGCGVTVDEFLSLLARNGKLPETNIELEEKDNEI